MLPQSEHAIFLLLGWGDIFPNLNGASLRNLSLNLCCSVSNVAHFLRRVVTSFACSGATCCFTVMASFFTLFHFSGSSWKQNEKQNKSRDAGEEPATQPKMYQAFLRVVYKQGGKCQVFYLPQHDHKNYFSSI